MQVCGPGPSHTSKVLESQQGEVPSSTGPVPKGDKEQTHARMLQLVFQNKLHVYMFESTNFAHWTFLFLLAASFNFYDSICYYFIYNEKILQHFFLSYNVVCLFKICCFSIDHNGVGEAARHSECVVSHYGRKLKSHTGCPLCVKRIYWNILISIKSDSLYSL